MKTTGYALRDALKVHELRRDAALAAFPVTLAVFPGEEKPKPQVVMDELLAAERAIAKLQVAQKRYNLFVTVRVGTEEMCLEEAVKRLGGDARAEKMWRSVAGPSVRAAYYTAPTTRDSTHVVAKETITPQEATKLATQAAKRAALFRTAIATGNTREVEIENLDPALFE